MTIHPRLALIENECLKAGQFVVIHHKETAKSHILLNLPVLADTLAIWSSISRSTSGPISWTILTDSERRLSKFTSAITSFRCSCSWKRHRNLSDQLTPKYKLMHIDAWETHCVVVTNVLVSNREENFQCCTKTLNLKFPPKPAFFTTYAIHQCTATYTYWAVLLLPLSLHFLKEHIKWEEPYISELFLYLLFQFWSTLSLPQLSFIKRNRTSCLKFRTIQ